tara:strand:- start:535 stop:726 length:192 start_codon:yes stop_codon:yes gene_type:complete
MKITIDESLCEGHAKCMERAPEVFEVGEDDLSHVIATDFDDALRAKAERAARSCPRQAITIEP